MKDDKCEVYLQFMQYFEFWYSSPIHLLLFTFQSQQQLPHAFYLSFILYSLVEIEWTVLTQSYS